MGDLTSWNPSARIPPSHGPCVSRCDGCWGQGVGLEKEPPTVWVCLGGSVLSGENQRMCNEA